MNSERVIEEPLKISIMHLYSTFSVLRFGFSKFRDFSMHLNINIRRYLVKIIY